MHAPDLSGPTTQWKLTAPESYVLLNGPQAGGAEAFRLALMELVGRGALRVVQVQQPGMLGLGRRVTVLAEGASPPADLDPTLESIWQVYTSLPSQTFPDGTVGVPVQELARAVQQRYGSLDGYVALQVLPALVERGLFRREEYRKLFLFPATRYVLTPDGRAARSELQGLIALGNRQFGGWAGQDPARALTFMGLAGASMFLMPLLLSE